MQVCTTPGLYNAGDGTQGFTHARQAQYQLLTYISSPEAWDSMSKDNLVLLSTPVTSTNMTQS